ncbi:MAG: glutamine synthetase III [Traorella sp.]
MDDKNILDSFGCYTFNDEVMRNRLPNSTYREFHESLAKGEGLSKECASVIANAMKVWAIEKGATHFTHWFTPMTGLSAEKHDSFLEIKDERPILEFSGKTLRKGESDASSFPSGGLRATFEARGYTAWDCTSYAFVKDDSLYIPTVFCSYNGEALDKKTPLLKSCDALSKAVTTLMHHLGYEDVQSAKSYVGAEQEYFLVSDEYYQKRIDLKLTGRTLFGASAPKGQELDDHYFGSLKRKVAAFMKELDRECWKYGIPSKTKHNEAAPAQHEIACIYRDVNITTDNNHLLMQLMQDIAKKHGLRCLLHEKPFQGVNGSGKHNNWSVLTDTGINLFNPGKDPINNLAFLATISCLVKGVHEYSDLLRLSVACPGNDHRLGANEAPPGIMSMYLGSEINNLFDSIIYDHALEETQKMRFNSGVAVVSDFSKDDSDRNRTSPFALTGNKFEFRAVGSSQSIAGVNTMLNTILAVEMNEMSHLIEQGHQPLEIIKKFYQEHEQIIFEGDGYSKEWEEEALRRGLVNRKNAVDAILHFIDDKNVEMLSQMGVYSKEEIFARYDILLENYIKVEHVEALTSLRMAKNQIYPVVIQYMNQVAMTCHSLKDMMVEHDYLLDDLKQLSNMTKQMNQAMKQLEDVLQEFNNFKGSVADKAIFTRDKVVGAMNELRKITDQIETSVDANIWPIPTYIDLMFGI